MVRHWVLVPAFAGSNPAGPAKKVSPPPRRYFLTWPAQKSQQKRECAPHISTAGPSPLPIIYYVYFIKSITLPCFVIIFNCLNLFDAMNSRFSSAKQRLVCLFVLLKSTITSSDCLAAFCKVFFIKAFPSPLGAFISHSRPVIRISAVRTPATILRGINSTSIPSSVKNTTVAISCFSRITPFGTIFPLRFMRFIISYSSSHYQAQATYTIIYS